MDKLGHTCRPKRMGYDHMHAANGLGLRLNSHTLLIIKLPDSRVLRMMSSSLLLAMVVLALPSLFSTMRASCGGVSRHNADLETANGLEVLPVLLRDLVEEGLVKKGHKGFILGTSEIGGDLEFLRDAGVDLLTGADLQQKNAVDRQGFDFVFAQNFYSIQLIDGMLRDSGLVITPLGHDPSYGLRFLSSYKIVYLRRFESTVVAMRKPGASSNGQTYSKEAFSGVTPEEKKAALKGLEDVDLEPPRRAASAERPSFTSRKIKFLPDLLKDTLDEYPRRVFVTDDSSSLEWLYKYYPTRDQEFEVYKMETGANNDDGSMGVANWLTKKVRQEDYVVMKAEAQVVEEMLKEKSLHLVDELFLECKNQWEEGEGGHESKRAYWQCLALYGKVRDEGIAVHQWWN